MAEPFRIFISYAHRDNESDDSSKRYLDRIRETLKPLLIGSSVVAWSDDNIKVGDRWDSEIKASLQMADAAILLVSPAFLASEYIRNYELPVILQNAKLRRTVIIPVILRPCLYTETKFRYPDPVAGPYETSLAGIQSVNPPESPLNSYNEYQQDLAFRRVAKTIATLEEQRQTGASPRPAVTPRPQGPTVSEEPNDDAIPVPALAPFGDSKAKQSSDSGDNWIPTLSFLEVSPVKLRQHLPYLLATLVMAVAGRILGSGRYFPEASTIAATLRDASIFALLATMLFLLIASKAFDHQFVLSLLRALLFLAMFYLLCAVMLMLDPGMTVHNLFVIAAMIIGSLNILAGGLAKFYWLEQYRGDLVVELIPFLLFLIGTARVSWHLLVA